MAATKETKQSAIDSPVDMLSDGAAKLYTHIHPVLTLSLLYFRFNAIVNDPVEGLAWLLPGTCLLQMLYSILCVPLSSGAAKTTPAATTSTPSKKGDTQPLRRKQAKAPASPLARIIPSIFSATLSLAAGTPVLAALLVLHGAPLTTHIAHTLLAAAHFAVLSSLPLFYAHGVDAAKWRAIASLGAPLDELLGAGVGVFVGAWLGAIPIPLDWDRPWQAWPVTVLAGAYAGWAAGKVLGATVLRGKRVRFDD